MAIALDLSTLSPESSAEDIAAQLYVADPNWGWNRDHVQVFRKWEQLSEADRADWIRAAEGLKTFLAVQQRDIALSVLEDLVFRISPNHVSIDIES